MNKRNHILIALICMSAQFIMSSQTQPTTSTHHIQNPFIKIMQRRDLNEEQKHAEMTAYDEAVLRNFKRKQSASDALLSRLAEQLNTLKVEAIEYLSRDANAQ